MFLVSFTAGLYEKFHPIVLPFMLQEQIKIEDPADVAVKVGNLQSMNSLTTIWLNITIGPLYDTVGRKIPAIFLFFVTTSGEALVPFVTTYNPGFIIISLM